MKILRFGKCAAYLLASMICFTDASNIVRVLGLLLLGHAIQYGVWEYQDWKEDNEDKECLQ